MDQITQNLFEAIFTVNRTLYTMDGDEITCFKVSDVIEAFEIPPDVEDGTYDSIYREVSDHTYIGADGTVYIPIDEITRLAFFGTIDPCYEFRMKCLSIHNAHLKTGWYDPERNHEAPVGMELDAAENKGHAQDLIRRLFGNVFKD